MGLLGFGLGLTLANCSKPDPKTINGTALYVTNLFDNSYKIRQLLFIGQNAEGNEIFQRDYRPSEPSSSDLASPQTVRILLSDSLDKQVLTLTVYAIDSDGEVAEFGSSMVTVAVGIETDVQVNMKAFEVPDAGTPDAGKQADSGGFDASLPDGGVAVCPCGSTCCVPDAGQPDGSSCGDFGSYRAPVGGGLPDLEYTLQFCGAPHSFCGFSELCDPFRANKCLQTGSTPTCSCGSLGAPCQKGMRCADLKGDGVYGCTCDVLSACNGCCGPNGNACREATTAQACGAAGYACESCGVATGTSSCINVPAGTGVCNVSPQCLSCTVATKCCTGLKCESTAFPTCRRAAPGSGGSACQACVFGQSDRCDPTTGGCACGAGRACTGQFETCKAGANGTASCQPL